MKKLDCLVLRRCFVAFFAFSSSGCSLLFVKSPPTQRAGGGVVLPGECTTSKVAPVLDSVITGFQVARTAYAATAPDRVYDDPQQPLSRGADLALGVGFTALFLGSAIYGYSSTSRCATLQKERHRSEDEETLATPSEPARPPPPSGQAPTPSPSTASPSAPAQPQPPLPAAPTAPTDAATEPAPASETAPEAPPAP